MRCVKPSRIFKLPVFLVLILLLLSSNAIAKPEVPQLVVGDCNKCHFDVVGSFFEQGGQHKETMNCLGCHLEHPPIGTESIPECGMCHDTNETSHYRAQGCLECHNPHAPLDVDYTEVESVRTVCVGCHFQPNEDFEAYPSAHSEMDCKECHQKHGDFFNCLECHQPHSDQIDEYADCLLCHKPHMPTVVRYPDTLSVSYCSGCHARQTKSLQNTTLKHSTFRCAFCHRLQHKTIPVCATCHGAPHAAALHRKFPDCRICHNGAHGLEK